MNKAKLKVGILLDSFEVPAWSYKALENIAKSDYAEITLLIVNTGKGNNNGWLNRLWGKRNRLVYFVLNKLDEYLYGRKTDAFNKKDLKSILPDTPVIAVNPQQKKFSDYFRQDDIEAIRKYDIDVLVRMGFRILRGEILNSARFGIWSYHHGDNRVNRGGPPGFWESIENWPETGATLQILSENLDGGKILYRSSSLTYYLSPAKNKNRLYWNSATFLPRQLERLYRLGENDFFREIEKYNHGPDFYSGRLYTTPSNLVAAKLLLVYFTKFAFKLWHKLFYIEQWYLMFDLKPQLSTTIRQFKEIIPPKDRFWADPHVVRHEDNYYIFLEELMYNTNRGHISVIKMDGRGQYDKPVRVLEKDYHLSYPFIVKLDNKYYMIPESAENKSIDIYESMEFPYKWQYKMSLMQDVRAVDATPLFHAGKWWLFVNMAVNEGASTSSELFLFYADDLLTDEWISHPQNPIISDTKSARPAGRVITKDGKLFRPSQDCSVIYGHKLNINEIEILSETEYQEKTLTTVTPDWDHKVRGVHSLAHEEELTVIDAFQHRRRIL